MLISLSVRQAEGFHEVILHSKILFEKTKPKRAFERIHAGLMRWLSS